jgi:hypothetical protein
MKMVCDANALFYRMRDKNEYKIETYTEVVWMSTMHGFKMMAYLSCRQVLVYFFN